MAERVEPTYLRQKGYEGKEDTSYKMEPSLRRIAIIFVTASSSQAVTNDAKNLRIWLERLHFIVIERDIHADKKYLEGVIKAVTTDDESDGSKNCCFFFAFLCNPDEVRSPETQVIVDYKETQIWDWLTLENSKLSTRPKIVLLQEYPNEKTAKPSAVPTGQQQIIPSKVHIFFIHGSGIEDYISTFTDIELNANDTYLKMEDFIEEVHDKIEKKNQSGLYPYYSSTLIYDLDLKLGKGRVSKSEDEKEEVKVIFKRLIDESVSSQQADEKMDREYMTKLLQDLTGYLPLLKLFVQNEAKLNADTELLIDVVTNVNDLRTMIEEKGGKKPIIRNMERTVKRTILKICKIVIPEAEQKTEFGTPGPWAAMRDKVHSSFRIV